MQTFVKFLGLDPAEEDEVRHEKSAREVPILTDKLTAFKLNIPAPSQMGPVLGRSSYIDDIAHAAPNWDQLCEDLNALLYRLRCWKKIFPSAFPRVDSASSPFRTSLMRSVPRIAKSVQELPFPTTLKGVQSFLGSLNYYYKLIEDFSVVAAALHELTDEQIRARKDLSRARESFEILKRRIVSTPLLRHPARNEPFIIIPHANRWAACDVLRQEYDGKILPPSAAAYAAEEYVGFEPVPLMAARRSLHY
ncbi:hypothetical protein PHMEG_00028384 [Phytophthora megakarya]|uniref:Reverse transcriptase n=1 Tax=Phytophthora megakarya TaxID=4795 RepID=A0A225V6N9_9STRA|nr:hypothetical protein PHMEG_00028384 [Phytophthora megakarya]